MKPEQPKHAAMSQFEVVDDCLCIGGVSISTLANRLGRTPFYAYDRRLISERVALLRQKFPVRLQLH
jgi:diaminopimelate decarboxylase